MLQRSVESVIPGEPMGKPSVQVHRGHAHMPSETIEYWDKMIREFRRQCPDFVRWEKGVPLRLTIRAYYGIPASDSKKQRAAKLAGLIRPTKTPDYDNIAKMIGDGLQKFAIYNDAQIVSGRQDKYYSDDPRVEIIITEVSE